MQALLTRVRSHPCYDHAGTYAMDRGRLGYMQALGGAYMATVPSSQS